MSILAGGFFKSEGTSEYTHPTFEGYSFEHGGAQVIAMESFDDSLAVLEALSEVDIHILRESSEEVVVEAAAKGVIEKIKNALKKLWGKIKAFFESIIRFFDGMTKSSADFAKKYEDRLRKLDLTSFKYKMFKYTITGAPQKDAVKAEDYLRDIAVQVGKSIDASKTSVEEGRKALESLKEQREEKEEAIRGEFAGGGKLSADEYRKALFSSFRGGAEGPEDKEEVNVDIFNILNIVKESPKLKKAIEAAKSFTDKSFNNYLKDFDNAQKAAISKNQELDGSANASIYAGLCQLYYKEIQFYQTTASQFFNAWIDAVKERDRTYKSVMKAAFSHKEK